MCKIAPQVVEAKCAFFTLVTYFNMLDNRKRKYGVNKSYILVMMFSFVFLQSIIKR